MTEEEKVEETEEVETPTEETTEQAETTEAVEDKVESKPERKDTRFTDLSEKVRTASEERDLANKRAEFAEGFVDVALKYKGADEYKEQIKEKVLGGYTIEDAALTVLAGEGKLQGAPKPTVAGGSAPVALPNTEDKPLSEYSQDEKRELLLKAEQEGDLARTFNL